MLEPAELKPCPFCGATCNDGAGDEPVCKWSDDLDGFVECGWCYARGPVAPFDAEAIAAWNRRALPEPAADLVEMIENEIIESLDVDWQPRWAAERIAEALAPHMAAREQARHNAAIEAAAEWLKREGCGHATAAYPPGSLAALLVAAQAILALKEPRP